MSNQLEPIWTKSFISIFMTALFIFTVFYALLALLPIYVTDDLQGSKTDAGLVVTVFLLSAIVVRPFSGKIMEIFGKKTTLIISTFLFALSSFAYSFIDQFGLLLSLRFFHGIWFSFVTTATGAIAADVIPIARRGEGLGYYAMSMNVGMVLGPFISLSLLSFIGYSWVFTVLGLFTILACLASLLVQIPSGLTQTRQKTKLTLTDLFEKKAVSIAVIGCLIAFSYSSIITFISLYAQEINLMDVASFFFVTFAIAMLISRPFVGPLFDKKGANVVVYPAFALFAIGLLLLSQTITATLFLVAAALIGFGYGSLTPSFQTIAVQSAAHHRSGHATATFFTFFDFGIASGSYVLGMVAASIGYQNLYFYVAIFVLLIGGSYTLLAQRSSKRLDQPRQA